VRTGNLAGTPVSKPQLTIVTFNIKFGEHAEDAATFLAAHPFLGTADVLLLQEMDEAGTRQIAQRLAMNYVYVPSAIHPHSSRDLGVAILSPWPIDDPHKVLLPGEHALIHMRRAAAAGTVRTVLGDVRVYAVHLETPIGAPDEGRRAQARAVLRDAASWSGPVVIAGDFNGTDAADELARAGLSWLTRRVHDTAGPFDFDHIVVSGLCVSDGPRVDRNPDLRRISDHWPVWTVVQPCPAG
jgi:endonuclease/exonuclease/phosphatase family metal-dependent hydrolase